MSSGWDAAMSNASSACAAVTRLSCVVESLGASTAVCRSALTPCWPRFTAGVGCICVDCDPGEVCGACRTLFLFIAV